MQNELILNALRVQPLSEEDRNNRHILGRLYGPIATCIESTRNGRFYNKQLWEKALADDVFLEKVATKSLFLELGHPADREETDMKQACACIPEVPKIVGDDLYAYVDILDTPNGQLLKTLVDYGFVPGISSRGSGDVLANNQVDPETFFLETWDIVQLPAVKKARLNVYESLDSDSIKLQKALAESYLAAKEEDKETMKKALENLNININEELPEANKMTLTDTDIPWDEEETLLEDAEDSQEEAQEETEVTEQEQDVSDTDTDEEADTIEEVETEAEDAKVTDKIVDVNAEEELEVDTVGDVVELLQDYDENMRVAFEAISVDGKKYPVEKVSASIDEDGEEDTLVLGVDCSESDLDEPNLDNTDVDIEDETEEASEEAAIEDDDSSKPADDDGDTEVIESLKEMIRQKEALETELSDLRKAKSVGDAKEHELQEKLSGYRIAFSKANAEAVKVPELQSKVSELTEHLEQSRKTIEELTQKTNEAQQLKESAELSEATSKELKEQVEKLIQQNKSLEAKLEEQTKRYNAKLQERTEVAKAYKKRCIETLSKYVDSKASMLGVASSEITSRLNESYTLSDIDAVCDKIMNSTVNLGRLPFSGRTRASARIAESVNKNTTASSTHDPAYGYDIDDSLLELAGLK